MAAPDAEAQEALDLHNHARKEVGNDPLEWHANLATDAAAYAKELAEIDSGLVHATQPKTDSAQGENLASSNGRDGNHLLLATQLWYDEKPNWDGGPFLGNKSGDEEDGHYTQMIWSTTYNVGIASATSASGTVYTVGRYYPPGNMIGTAPAKQAAPPSAPTHPGAGGGGMGRPGGGSGGPGGGPGAPNRPGAFGGGKMGGMPGMGGGMPPGMPGMMPGMPGMPPGMPTMMGPGGAMMGPWGMIAPGMGRGMPPPFALRPPHVVARLMAIHGMPPPWSPDYPTARIIIARGPPRPPPGWPHRPPIWTPFGWR